MPTLLQALILATAVLAAHAPPQAPAQQSDRRTWTEVPSLEGGFLVELPSAPQRAGQPITGADGSSMHVWMVEIDRGWTAYTVGFSDISTARRQSATSDVILGDAVQGALRQTGWALVSETPIEFQGHPGREVVMTSADRGVAMRISARIVLAGLRVYQQMAVTSDLSKLEPGEVERYFKSFLLLVR